MLIRKGQVPVSRGEYQRAVMALVEARSYRPEGPVDFREHQRELRWVEAEVARLAPPRAHNSGTRNETLVHG